MSFFPHCHFQTPLSLELNRLFFAFVFLLHMHFSLSQVSDDHFEVLLLYLDGLRGTARDSTLQKAEAIVRWEGQGEEADRADAEKRKRRAKQVVQML